MGTMTNRQKSIYSSEFSDTFGTIHIPKLVLIRETVAEISKKRKIERIFDIASGDGLVTKELETYANAEVLGCDISSVCVRKARKRNLQIINIDLNQGMPFQDETFDMVTAFDIYEHVVELDHLQKEILRILKPNGLLVLTTPNLGSMMERLFLLLGFQPLGVEVSQYRKFGAIPHRGKCTPVGHIRTLTLRAWKEFLEYYNFNVTQVKRCPLRTPHSLVNLIDNSIGRLFLSLSNELLIVCEKSSGSLEV
jgi:SAM-dependent methyltransferase